jgi:hypothetical protein
MAPELKGRKKKWILHRTGISNVSLKFEANRNDARVILEINHRSESRRLHAFEVIQRYKQILEHDFEDGLSWDFLHIREDSGQQVCRIYTTLMGADYHKRSHWSDIFDFYIENMMRLERNFLGIKDWIEDEINYYDPGA